MLVETKLLKNPQARREVVAQAIDYARRVCRWTYEDMEAAFKRFRESEMAAKDPRLSAWKAEAARQPESSDEVGPLEQWVRYCAKEETPALVDQVDQNLRSGRLVVAIVGDEIKPETWDLVKYLSQASPGLHFTLHLIELTCYREGGSGPVLVVPRVAMGTNLVERAVVTIRRAAEAPRDADVEVEVAPPTGRAVRQRRSLSEEEYRTRIRNALGDRADDYWRLIEDVQSEGLSLEFCQDAVMAKLELPTGKALTVMKFSSNGRLCPGGWLPGQLRDAGVVDFLGAPPREPPSDFLEKAATLERSQGVSLRFWGALAKVHADFAPKRTLGGWGEGLVPFDAIKDRVPAVLAAVGELVRDVSNALGED